MTAGKPECFPSADRELEEHVGSTAAETGTGASWSWCLETLHAEPYPSPC